MPREKRQAILAAAAALAEHDYRDDKELTGFDAFQEEECDDDEYRLFQQNPRVGHCFFGTEVDRERGREAALIWLAGYRTQ